MDTQDAIRDAVELAGKGAPILVATASGDGLPHLAVAASMIADSGRRLRIRYWFCPTTISNLEENLRVSIVVWEPARDAGYQVVGKVETVLDTAIADGYSPVEETHAVAQVERELIVSVAEVVEFRRQAHDDHPL